jgi:hypothetical protein
MCSRSPYCWRSWCRCSAPAASRVVATTVLLRLRRRLTRPRPMPLGCGARGSANRAVGVGRAQTGVVGSSAGGWVRAACCQGHRWVRGRRRGAALAAPRNNGGHVGDGRHPVGPSLYLEQSSPLLS